MKRRDSPTATYKSAKFGKVGVEGGGERDPTRHPPWDLRVTEGASICTRAVGAPSVQRRDSPTVTYESAKFGEVGVEGGGERDPTRHPPWDPRVTEGASMRV